MQMNPFHLSRSDVKIFFFLSILLLMTLQIEVKANGSTSKKDTDSLHLQAALTKSEQLIIGLAPDWNNSYVTLQAWERSSPQAPWQPTSQTWKGRLGKNGLAWGRGLHGMNEKGLSKKEGDGRSPAGVFSLGGVYGYAPSLNCHPALHYHTISETDLWVEDPASPHYNQHLRLSRTPITEWEKKQQMKQNDPAHSLKLFIHHNALPNIAPGAGSSIFFHIWRREGEAPSSGCTVMAKENLEALIRWLNPEKYPLYVLLPSPVYQEKRASWQLP